MTRGVTLIGLASLVAIGAAQGYEIRPFTGDKPIRSSSDRWRYYFEMPRGATVVKDASFTVDYDAAANLFNAQGRMTVLLNDQPVDSRSLSAKGLSSGHWVVTVPKRFFKPGFNELAIQAVSHEATGPCREDDDYGTWLRLRSSSLFRFSLAKPTPFPLSGYPFPYVDWLSQPAATAPIALPTPINPTDIAQALNLASSWGKRLVDRPLRVQVTTEAPAGPAVYVGLRSELKNPKIETALQVRGDDLYISGGNASDLDAAVRTLTYPVVVSQLRGFGANPIAYSSRRQEPSAKIGAATFEELGFPAINLQGTDTQSTTLVLRRPILTPLGRGGQIRLRFRHAATLLAPRSLLSVSVNDIPLGSVALTPDNAGDGQLVCPIPVQVADRNEWVVRIDAHHELGSVDCGRRYSDVAWTNILGTSEFELKEGGLPAVPYLEGFPYFRDREGKLKDGLKVGLSAAPTDVQLSVAATIAARAAQTNRVNISWLTAFGPVTGHEDLLIGLNTEEARFQSLNGLLLAPSRDGALKLKRDLPIVPSRLVGAAVLQAITNGTGGVTYVLLAANDKILARFADYLATGQNAANLRGQLAIFTNEGELFTFDTLSPSDRRAAEAAEMQRYKPEMRWDMTVVIVVIAGLLVFVASRFVKRKPAKA